MTVISKTPQFDRKLDALLRDLKPHERVCGSCGQKFQIFQEDIDFYHMLRVPPPKLCPLCRKRRRFGHLIRAPKFFKRPCQAPGHAESVVTVFPPSAPHIVYDYAHWNSDAWDATAYGRPHDPTRSFLNQYRDLFFSVPQVPLERSPAAVNCEYTVGGMGGKNNYICAMAYKSEDCMYCFDAWHSHDLVDCSIVHNSELCYDSVSSDHCTNCIAVVDSSNCLDSAFLYDCKNCSNSFLSSNLRNRTYTFENEQLTKEEYMKRRAAVDLGDRTVYAEHRRKFAELFRAALHRALRTTSVTASVGSDISECSDVYFTFRSERSQRLRYCDNADGVKDLMDVVNVIRAERCYESIGTFGMGDKFAMYARNSNDVEYSAYCHDCRDCFGCVGLKNKQQHVFNRPYGEDDYWKLVDRIKTKMLDDGEYGEFFPLALGFVPYQSSNAQKEWPLEGEQARAAGIPWYDEPETNAPPNTRVLHPADIPPRIADVTDGILDATLICETTGRPFRLTRGELDFYRRMNVPIPTKYYWQRLMERAAYERPVRLYDFTCSSCGIRSYSTYSADQQRILKVLCEPCYLKEVV
jgi:hypothetical protein